MIPFSIRKLRKKSCFGPLEFFLFLFQLSKFRKSHETNWWKHLMNSLRDYLSLQNMIEVLMISLSVAFFAIENSLENDETGI